MNMLILSFVFDNLGQWLMLLGAALIIFMLIINIRRYYRRQNREYLDPHEKLERIKQNAALKNDMRTMMVELEELTRRFSAQLDAKSLRLEKLLDEANNTITKLRKTNTPTPNSPPLSDPVDILATAPNKNEEPPLAESDNTGNDNDEPDNLVKNIYQLSDSGKSSVDIAQQLDEQVGKIELILALRQQ